LIFSVGDKILFQFSGEGKIGNFVWTAWYAIEILKNSFAISVYHYENALFF